MKKAIPIALCLVLALSLCVPACAEYTVEDFVAELQEEDLGYDYYEVTIENDIVCMYVSMDGMAEAVANLKDEEDLDAWKEVTDALDELSLSLRKAADENFEDLLTCVYLCNDLDIEKVIYVSVGGECIYDRVTYTVEDYVQALREVETDWDYFEVEMHDGVIYYYLGMDGVAENAAVVKDAEDFDSWKEVTDELDAISVSTQEEASMFFEDVETCVVLIDDTDPDSWLYMVADGVCHHDWVRDYDINAA